MSESDLSSTKLLALRCTINLSIFFYIVVSCTFSAAAIEDDGEAKALLNWKASLTKQSQATLSSWNNGTNLCRNWEGIICDDESMSVISISLSNLSLQSTLENLNFASFPNLIYFDLSYNQFYGNIPHEIGNLSSILNMSFTVNPSISGPIPKEIGALSTLILLDLSACNLRESIPGELGKGLLKILFLVAFLKRLEC